MRKGTYFSSRPAQIFKKKSSSQSKNLVRKLCLVGIPLFALFFFIEFSNNFLLEFWYLLLLPHLRASLGAIVWLLTRDGGYVNPRVQLQVYHDVSSARIMDKQEFGVTCHAPWGVTVILCLIIHFYINSIDRKGVGRGYGGPVFGPVAGYPPKLMTQCLWFLFIFSKSKFCLFFFFFVARSVLCKVKIFCRVWYDRWKECTRYYQAFDFYPESNVTPPTLSSYLMAAVFACTLVLAF